MRISTHNALHSYIKDYLGNNRVVVNEDGTVEQTTHYYPFGGDFADAGTNAALQPYTSLHCSDPSSVFLSKSKTLLFTE